MSMNMQSLSTSFSVPSLPHQQPIDPHDALTQDDASRAALDESVHLLTCKGIKGERMLHELLKVNLQLPSPVDLLELPIIANYPTWDAEQPEHYLQVIQRLQEAEQQFLNPAPAEEEEPRPTISDVDQALAAKDLKALYAHLPALVDIRARSAVEWALKKQEIKEALGKAVNLLDLERAVAAEQRQMEKAFRPEEPDIANIARDWAYMNRHDWGYDARNKVWRRWTGTHWEELEKSAPELGNEAVDALHNAGRDINTNGAIETFLRCAADARATLFAEGQSGKVNFENGTLDIATMCLHPHQREDYLTYCLPYDYTPGSHTLITSTLEQIIPDPYARTAFMVHLGLALMGDTKLHQVVILLGTTRSGKTTLLALGNIVCGAHLYEAFDFADHHLFSRELEGKRARYVWNSRRLVGVDEVPAEALRDEELFKQMSAHSGVGMRGMHKDDKTNNRWRPKLLLAANDQPRYRDIVGAVRERSIFIECPNHRPKGNRDLNLIDKMASEIGAFAASCIYLAKMAVERGYYPASSRMKLVLDRIDKEGSYLKTFLAEACVITPDSGDQITTDDLYQHYVSFCENNRVQRQYHLTKSILSRQIAAMRLGVTHTRMLNEDNVMVRGLVNIRLRSQSDIWETEDEELRRFQSDEPLLNGVLTVIDGKLTVVPLSVNDVEQPVEPAHDDTLTDMTDKNEKISSQETPVLDPPPVTQHTEEPIEQIISSDYVSYPSTAALDAPVEPARTTDRCADMPASDVSGVRCEVKGCDQPAESASQEDAALYGQWCGEHQDRQEMMVFGGMLREPYARLQYNKCGAVVAGRENWHLFGTYPNAPVSSVLQAINDALALQDEETA